LAVARGLNNFIDIPSVMIVIGGGLAATIMSIPLRSLGRFGGVLKTAFRNKKTDPRKLIGTLVKISEVARREGILALESFLDRIDDPFLTKGIQMAVDGTDPEIIHDMLDQELQQMKARHDAGRSIFETMGKYAPAFGMIGTLVGLILMLSQLDDPSEIAPNMAVALVTTFYGALLANSFFLPLADKLAKKTKEEALQKEIIINGVISIQSGDNPRMLEQKLKVYLPPEMR